MVDQFVAENSDFMRHQLTTWYFDNRSDLRATPGQFRWYKSPGPGLKIGAKPRGLPGEMFALGID